ncbi:MAG: DNA-binding NarL/FixJ family response regulator [Arenicella sp.]|jgi:DNA-binding NarL/FixJ family response regulator
MELGNDTIQGCLLEFSSTVMALAERCQIEGFKSSAIELLADYLNFDSAQWVTRARIQDEANRSYLAAAYLYNLDRSKLAAYQPYILIDPLLAAVIAKPNKAVNLSDIWLDHDYYSSELYLNYAKQYGLERVLSIVVAKEGVNFSQAISVYRATRAHLFSAVEVDFYQQCSHWLTLALRHNILENVGSSLGIEGIEKPRAVIDKDGFIFEIDAHLENWLRSQFLNYNGAYFPNTLLQQLASDIDASNTGSGSNTSVSTDYKHYRLQVVQQGDLYLVYFHCSLPFDRLTAREWQVARSALESDGNKSIARKLGNEPGTVQKHLQNIYLKLGISELNDNHEKRRMLNMLLSDYLRQHKKQTALTGQDV